MPSCANQMRVEIKRLQHRLKVTTIYVTHDQIEAMTLADVIEVMKDGAIASPARRSTCSSGPRTGLSRVSSARRR